MSDSDDTDILLLIPPNYFIERAEYRQHNEKMDADSVAMPPPQTTAAYQFLPPSKKFELNHINTRLQNIEHHEDYNFAAPSDISTISTSTVRTQLGKKKVREIHGLVHSTPKCSSLNTVGIPKQGNAYGDDGILHEIDNYLDEHNHNYKVNNWQHHSDDYGREQEKHLQFTGVAEKAAQAKSLPSALNRQTVQASATEENKLISLSEIWGKSGQATAIPSSNVTLSTIKEEQLRRQHLERTVNMLQTQMLEYQQRISVAIEVDRSKDAALETAQEECKRLNNETQYLRERLRKFESERQENNCKIDSLRNELTQAVSLATKFQEKNEKLEQECATLTKQCNEAKNLHKQQLEELELKVHGSKRAEEFSINELEKFKDKYAKTEHQNEKLKTRCEELEKENTTLKHQKEMLQEFHQKQKSRADSLETQRKSMQDTLANLTENESVLQKKLEMQPKALKAHYQQQLENVVTKKLKEFQEQLDRTEETLKAEARERERLIAERAVKQLEMINEKNDLELNLLQEKHNEEVELYRLQLANASKKIDDLDMKLNCYKSKRADIAEKLHNVMEAQWQKALEILTSPNQTGQLNAAETDCESPDNNERNFETPKTSKSKTRKSSTNENNLDVVCKKDPPSPMDKLQAYIELLLSKSPSDLDKLDEILSLTTKAKTAGKFDKSGKRLAHMKPPWKA